MELSGGRSSWPSASRNSSFSRPERSASMRAARSNSSKACSSWSESVMRISVLPEVCTFRRTLAFIGSQRGKHPLADNIAPPAAQHAHVAASISEQLEVTPGCQHFGTQTQIRGNGLVQGSQFFDQRAL